VDKNRILSANTVTNIHTVDTDFKTYKIRNAK